MIRFPAVGQKDRSKGENAEVEGREGKNGRESLDGKITSTQAAVALSAHHKKCGQIKASPHSCKIGYEDANRVDRKTTDTRSSL